MYYLIDGYNLLFHLADSKETLQTQRRSLIRSLQMEFAHLGLEGMIVFDGSYRRGEESGLAYKSPLVIAYTAEGESADHFILEKIQTAQADSHFVVVTNDRFLASSAERYKARTLTLRAFVQHLEKKLSQRRNKKEEGRSFKESKTELERLLKIFEERLQQDE